MFVATIWTYSCKTRKNCIFVSVKIWLWRTQWVIKINYCAVYSWACREFCNYILYINIQESAWITKRKSDLLSFFLTLLKCLYYWELWNYTLLFTKMLAYSNDIYSTYKFLYFSSKDRDIYDWILSFITHIYFM